MQEWTPLVVDVGELAFTEGQLLRVGTGFLLATAGAQIDSRSSVEAISRSLQVQLPDTIAETEWRHLLGRHVVATGRVTSSGLQTDQLSVDEKAEPSCEPVRLQADPTAVRPWQPRSSMEHRLITEGLLLDRWVEHSAEGDRQVALATNPTYVEAELAASGQPCVRVIASRWTVAELERVETIVSQLSELVSLGRVRDNDGQMKVAATFTHLTTEASRCLQPFADALAVDVLLKPHPPQHPIQ